MKSELAIRPGLDQTKCEENYSGRDRGTENEENEDRAKRLMNESLTSFSVDESTGANSKPSGAEARSFLTGGSEAVLDDGRGGLRGGGDVARG